MERGHRVALQFSRFSSLIAVVGLTFCDKRHISGLRDPTVIRSLVAVSLAITYPILMLSSAGCGRSKRTVSAGTSVVTAGSPTSVPDLPPPPELPPAKPVGAGVLLHEVSLRHTGLGKLWIYLPEQASRKPLSCILIPPAGNAGCVPLDLNESDRPEHLPYVRAGFAVVAFALGNCQSTRKLSDAEFLKGAKDYMNLEAGLVNARYALDYLEKRVPAIDSDRVYIAGHSSAATNALCIAAREPRLRGCIAYAPGWTDLLNKWTPHWCDSSALNVPVTLNS